jgi:hypothetical protein
MSDIDNIDEIDNIENDVAAVMEQLINGEDTTNTPDEPTHVEKEDDEIVEDKTDFTEDKPEEAEPSKQAINAPTSWSADYKKQFASLPPEVQSYILQRESEQTGAITKATQEAAKLRAYDQVLQRYQHKIGNFNLKGPDLVDALIRGQLELMERPNESLQKLAADFGISLQSTQTQQDGSKRLETRGNDELETAILNRISQLENTLSRQSQAAQEQYLNVINSEVESIVSEKNPDGGLKFPHFDLVSESMAQIADQLVAQNPQQPVRRVVEEAYQTAVWLNPELRQKEVQRLIQVEQAKAISDQKKRVEQAKKASSSIKSGSSATSSNLKNVDVDDILGDVRGAFAELS